MNSKINASVATLQMSGNLGRKSLPQLRSAAVKSPLHLCAYRVDLSKMKMSLKHKMKAEVSLVDRTDRLGAIKTEEPCQQPCYHWCAPYMYEYIEYNYDHA